MSAQMTKKKVGRRALLRKRSSLKDADMKSNLIVKVLHRTTTISMIDRIMYVFVQHLLIQYTHPKISSRSHQN
jgi:hypothetical protein